MDKHDSYHNIQGGETLPVPDTVKKHAPTLIFSKGEHYFPCSLFFAGKNIINNKQEYEKLSFKDRLDEVCCYYHVVKGQRYTVYQYWYYYTFNEYTADDHEHDFEYLMVFADKKTEQPRLIVSSIHFFTEVTPIDKEVPAFKVERGGHGLFTQKKRWRWKHGFKLRIPPTSSCEQLRDTMMDEMNLLINKQFKLKGDDYFLFGKKAAPKAPWARWEYYLPEKSIRGLDLPPAVDLSGVPGIDRSVPYTRLVEMMRDEPEELEEHREEIVERTTAQLVTKSPYSTRSRKQIIQAFSDTETHILKGLQQPPIQQTGPILLDSEAETLQDAIALARSYRVITKKQYQKLRKAGIEIQEEDTITPSRWQDKHRQKSEP